ncbi:MAG TPA: hypothetical protein VED47_04245, partial [Burkholderiaceae bacterium]|nr:hypothetical protein [Burkholderiaceae bacterium]
MAIHPHLRGTDPWAMARAPARRLRGLRAALVAAALATPGAPSFAQETEAPATLPTVVVEAPRAELETSGSVSSISSAPIATTPLAID